MKRALFLTFDGTLITTLSGRKYSIHSEDWKFILPTVTLIKSYIEKGYVIALLINQPKVKEGIINFKTFNIKLELVLKTLERDLKKNNIIKYAYCLESNTYHSLPNAGMIYALALDYELDIVNSILASRDVLDKEIAINSGIKYFININNLIN
jgi:histidinol phosphatase-like enzyme